MIVHLVFYVSLLDPATLYPLLGQLQPPLAPIIIDKELEWEVNKILKSKFMGITLRYLCNGSLWRCGAEYSVWCKLALGSCI